ncbi:MAG: AAA family ATPase, partial [Fervidobacterium sp.]|nr:AAA family ATPase [Fervidobacterium sp.]
MKPTKEQEMIIQAAGKYDKLKVIARAGTGKSSTIRMMMEEYVEPSIYLVYNKALKDEAETWVPSHVSVKTMHGLAYRVAGPELRHKLNPKNNPPYIKINRLRSTKELAKQFSLPTFYGDDGADLSGLGVASYLKEAMKRWEMSIDRDITTKHLPLKRIINDSAKHGWDKDEIIKVLEHTLKEWWKLRINPTHQSAIAHETLVKLWHLSDPEVEWGRIYIDEAQDIFPIVLDVIKKQEDKKIVIVGDDKQSIYMFTGAVNSLDYFPYHTLPLTQSFRYGQDIADLAVCAFPEKVELKGSPTIKSKIGEVDTSKPYAHLFRTNAALVNEGVR